MEYLQFRNRFFDLGCINVHQIYAWRANFEKMNLTRWTKQNLLIKLRNGYYSFPEYLHQPNFGFFISNRIYRPSYVSLHSALAFYGIIPEAVVQISAVGALKKAVFENAFGIFTYRQLAPNLLFGYDVKPFLNGQTLLLAQPEKALLDLLYLYPFYNTPQEMEELRLDENFLEQQFNVKRFKAYADKFQTNALNQRAALLLKQYGL
jgi:predicted transcriptional regulator of viral defense system